MDRCPLCREIDRVDHFLKCRKLNECKDYNHIRDKMRHKAHAEGMSDHMINVTAKVMTGKALQVERAPLHARGI